MKNVLFVGPYRQTDGWGNASREYLTALLMTSHNISSRPVYLNTSIYGHKDLNQFEQAENNRSENYDVIIQHCLPHQFRRYGNSKNIGISFFETSNLKYTPWIEPINTMDEMWVTSEWEARALYRGGVKIPIKVVHIPVDTTKYDKKYNPFSMPNHANDFKFYFIGEYITRKNIPALLTAFHREFDTDEPVRLVLKVNRSGVDPFSLVEYVKRDINQLKQDMALYQRITDYKQEIIIPGYLSEDELYGLHTACDCFVMPSKGEAFCLPAFDAMVLGKYPLVNANSSMKEFITPYLGDTIDSYLVPAIAVDRPLPFLYTGRDCWYDVDITDLQRLMRYAFTYHNKSQQEETSNIAKRLIQPTTDDTKLSKYCYQSVSRLMENLL